MINFPKNVLLVDDEPESPLLLELISTAKKRHNIFIKQVSSLEEAKEELVRCGGETNFIGIILDFLCKIHKTQSVADKKFFGEAKAFFSNATKSIPIVYLTSFQREMAEIEKSDIVFKKDGNDLRRLLQYLVEKSETLDHVIIRNSYPDVFDIFRNKYLPSDLENSLFHRIKALTVDDITIIRENGSQIRVILEAVLNKLSLVDGNIFPDYCNTIVDKLKYLESTQYISRGTCINKTIYYVHKVTSHSSAHYNNPPTNYAYRSLLYALLDILLWFKEIMDNHYESRRNTN